LITLLKRKRNNSEEPFEKLNKGGEIERTSAFSSEIG